MCDDCKRKNMMGSLSLQGEIGNGNIVVLLFY